MESRINTLIDATGNDEFIERLLHASIKHQKISACLYHNPPNIVDIFWLNTYEKWLICMGLWDTYEMIK